ncbi:MAG: hypothetical protein HQL05_06015 [Nitrospirae bacterium]|uniref:hypothetical protein n=1 Tax=Candidatus Magnetobacterium casense TaxID=1455061 RepID=UPI00058FE8C2|nr:hypothetical protein [Candidatus Magnetobacterium casensis]MBF0337370.1 hypothetical protein [Nitrospirota bacterium]
MNSEAVNKAIAAVFDRLMKMSDEELLQKFESEGDGDIANILNYTDAFSVSDSLYTVDIATLPNCAHGGIGSLILPLINVQEMAKNANLVITEIE